MCVNPNRRMILPHTSAYCTHTHSKRNTGRQATGFGMHRHAHKQHILHSWQASKNIMKYSAGVAASTCLSYFFSLCADLSELRDELLPVYLLASVPFLRIWWKCEFVCVCVCSLVWLFSCLSALTCLFNCVLASQSFLSASCLHHLQDFLNCQAEQLGPGTVCPPSFRLFLIFDLTHSIKFELWFGVFSWQIAESMNPQHLLPCPKCILRHDLRKMKLY